MLITNNPQRGLLRFDGLDPSEDMPADCVIFGCAGLGMAGVKAFAGFIENHSTAQLPSILITKEKVADGVPKEWFNDHRVLLNMPLKFKLVKRALRKVLNLEIE